MQQDDSNIYIVSDGGVYNYEVTYGVVISDGNNPLMKNYGKLYSLDFCESSYRSESYAMLAGIITLQAVSKEYGELSGDNIAVHLVSDNKLLVRKINNRLKNKRTTNQHRDSDVDLRTRELLINIAILMWTWNCNSCTRYTNYNLPICI
jgi:hypothetical protein